MKKNGKQVKPLLSWTLPPWAMNGQGGWITQPVILVEGQTPFFADHPDAYMDKLQKMHDDATLMRGPFYTCMGQLRDAVEQAWQVSQEVVIWPAKR